MASIFSDIDNTPISEVKAGRVRISEPEPAPPPKGGKFRAFFESAKEKARLAVKDEIAFRRKVKTVRKKAKRNEILRQAKKQGKRQGRGLTIGRQPQGTPAKQLTAGLNVDYFGGSREKLGTRKGGRFGGFL